MDVRQRASGDETPVGDWRRALLTRVGWVVALGGGAAVTAYVVRTGRVQPTALGTATVGLLVALGVALAERWSTALRGSVLVAALLVASAGIAHDLGPAPGLVLSLALATAVAATVLGARGGFVALASGAAVFVVFGASGRRETATLWAEDLPHLDTWVRMTATYCLLAGLLVLLVSRALGRVEESLAEAQAALADAERDRAGRARAEETLRDSEERLRIALEAAEMGTWEWDVRTDAVVWSGATQALLAVPSGTRGGRRNLLVERVHPDDREAVKRALSRALAEEGSVYQVQYRVLGADPPRWLEGRGRVYRDDAGQPIAVRGTVADVTARRQAEEALRRSEAELSALFAAMKDVILVLDSDGRYLRIAPSSPELLYRPRAELLGRLLRDVFPEPQAEEFLGNIRRCLGTRRTVEFEYCLEIAGSPIWFSAAVSPMPTNTVVWVARDITERRRAMEELRSSEERWRRISEATFEGIGLTENGVVVDANAQLAAMLGYERQELLGAPVMRFVAPEDRERVGTAIRSGHTTAYVHNSLRKDGSAFPVETRARTLTHRGRTVRVTAVRDLSERVRLEAELRRRETLAAMGSLVAGVAHEVRTPLFSLSASLDALEAGSGTPEERQELKDLLRSQVGRLSDLMRDLLEYARPPQLDLVRGSIAEPLRLARNTCGTLASRNGVRLSLDVPDSLPPVRLDPGRVEEVFENLIANAVQHSPQGATVTIRAHALGAPRPGVRCTVEDEGPGLALEDIGHVFEPFFSRRKGGTGLGLAIAQRFVEAHGGTIGVANRPAGGALFTVVLHDSLEAPEAGRG